MPHIDVHLREVDSVAAVPACKRSLIGRDGYIDFVLSHVRAAGLLSRHRKMRVLRSVIELHFDHLELGPLSWMQAFDRELLRLNAVTFENPIHTSSAYILLVLGGVRYPSLREVILVGEFLFRATIWHLWMLRDTHPIFQHLSRVRSVSHMREAILENYQARAAMLLEMTRVLVGIQEYLRSYASELIGRRGEILLESAWLNFAFFLAAELAPRQQRMGSKFHHDVILEALTHAVLARCGGMSVTNLTELFRDEGLSATLTACTADFDRRNREREATHSG